MKLTCQVNDSCESIPAVLTVGNKFDWSKLAKIDLHLANRNHDIVNDKRIISDVMQKNKHDNTPEQILSEAYNTNINSPVEHILSSDAQLQDEQTHICDKKSIANFERYNEITPQLLHIEDTKSVESVDKTDNFLITLMKTNLSDVLHEGLLDSVLPYMIPKPIVSQPIIKKSLTSTETKKSNSASHNIDTRAITSITRKEKERDKSKGTKRSTE